jgi:hypothetical protein
MNTEELAEVYSGARAEGAVLNTLPAGMPKKLQPKHLRAVALKAAGWANFEIAEMLGWSEPYTSQIINHPMLQDYKQEMAEEVARTTLMDARTVIQAHTMDAALKLVTHMNSETESISFRAAESILDRGGIPKAEVLQATQLLLDKNEMHDLRKALDDIMTPVEEVTDVVESHTVLTKMREAGAFLKDKVEHSVAVGGGSEGELGADTRDEK